MSEPPVPPRRSHQGPLVAVVLLAGLCVLAIVILVAAHVTAPSRSARAGGLLGGGLSFGEAPTLPPPPPPSEYGTAREIGTRGDSPNPRALYHGAYPDNAQTQERRVGGPPARFSGYTTWVRSVARVPARLFVDGYPGVYLRVNVTVFNRDTEDQQVCACDFYVYTRAHGVREADAVGARTLAPYTTMKSGARLDGNVYLYVGTVSGPFYVVYNPDAHSGIGYEDAAKAVWKVPSH